MDTKTEWSRQEDAGCATIAAKGIGARKVKKKKEKKGPANEKSSGTCKKKKKETVGRIMKGRGEGEIW